MVDKITNKQIEKNKTKKVTIKFRRKDFDDKHKGYSTETMSALELIARLIQHIHYPA